MCGAIRALMRTPRDIQGCIGTSVGALLALAVCIGVEDRLPDALDSIDWSCLRGYTVPSFFDTYGLKPHDGLVHLVEHVLALAGLHAHITLQDLHRLTHRHFCCCLSNVCASKVAYMDHLTAPSVRVCDAVVASMCVPILFEPFTINGVLYVDGGLTENVPIRYFDPAQSVVLRVVSESKDVSNWREYLLSLLRCAQMSREERDMATMDTEVHTLIIPNHVPQSMELGSIHKELIRFLLTLGFVQCLPERYEVRYFMGVCIDVVTRWVDVG